MRERDWLFRPADVSFTFGLAREIDDWGQAALDLARPPARFWSDDSQIPSTLLLNVDKRRTEADPSPAQILSVGPTSETWRAQSQRSISRLFSWFLVCEDRQGRLLAQEIATLAHQASLVQHVLQTPALNRVLIGDEVGLGKTVEAGLILRELFAQNEGLRVLYLAPARLVANVHREFQKLGLQFRIWVAGVERNATLHDPRVIASIHRAAHPSHLPFFLEARPWDVLIVDECHHLSAWEPGGGNPVQRYKLVDELRKRLAPSGRLILLSGTPHQGHPHRFRNLVDLLREESESEAALAGRVIYRTKDDVRDWEGRPLFPGRQVNPPLVVDLGEEHRQWLRDIHELFEPHRFAVGSEPSQRAAGWRAGQALQWATSSIHAGLGYLVRQAIRAGWNATDPTLKVALEGIRPYRGGAAEEPAQVLYQRIAGEIRRQATDGDVEDMEVDEDLAERWRPDAVMLRKVLAEGVDLIARVADRKWEVLETSILELAGREKVVLFAQPIETVMALAGYLQRTRGVRPALIVGNQPEADRQREIESFWDANGPQFLISSRAGGEGINLQIARRLVHLDVPWNPMEMEQRVGRVHRFMSRQTIIVDTMVVSQSREVDVYKVARGKLEEISRTLVLPERFEGLFSRVMALVPPDELQGILAARPLGPLDAEEQGQLVGLVTAGFARWRDFHNEYGSQQQAIGALDPGEASWLDLRRFAEAHLKASAVDGYSALRFQLSGDEVEENSSEAIVLAIDGQQYSCGDYGGMPVTNSEGKSAKRLGLNTPAVAGKLRELGLPDRATGAAHVRWPSGRKVPGLEGEAAEGLLIFCIQKFKLVDGAAVEVASRLVGRAVGGSGATVQLEDRQLADAVRVLLNATVRMEPAEVPSLLEAMESEEARLVEELREPTASDRANRLLNVVTPLFASILS